MKGKTDPDSDAPTRSGVLHRGRRESGALRPPAIGVLRTPQSERLVRVQGGGHNATNSPSRPASGLHSCHSPNEADSLVVRQIPLHQGVVIQWFAGTSGHTCVVLLAHRMTHCENSPVVIQFP